MNLLERVFTLLRANLNSVAEKADDPEKALRQLQLDMRNQLVQVKTQVATAITASRKMQARADEKKVEADTWYKRAEQALARNNEATAREALTRYNDLVKLAQRYQQQQQEQEQLVTTMRNALRQLENKIAEVETTIDVLVARKRNALLQQRVYDTLSKSGTQGDRERANRAQDVVMEAEARARAMADLHNRDLDVQLDQLSRKQDIEQQLRDLKARQQMSKQPPLLTEGKEDLAELLSPTPQNNEPSRKRIQNHSARQEGSQAQQGQGTPGTQSTPMPELDIEELKRLMDK
jgi:phage shock protein A